MKTIVNSTKVIMVRVYVIKPPKLTRQIIEALEHKIQIRGLSIFNVIRGYGNSGEHYLSILDGRWDLPIVIEFFDSEEKAKEAIEYLNGVVNPEHIVFWEAYANLPNSKKF